MTDALDVERARDQVLWEQWTTHATSVRALSRARNDDACERAAMNGDLECLKYAHEHGCPWDEETCRLAATNGHLECLQYAHEHGCPLDETTCERAAEKGSAYDTRTSTDVFCTSGRADAPPISEIWSF